MRPVYRPAHVAIATLLGGPFAGGLLLALTLHRTGSAGAAWASALSGGALALAAVTVGERLGLPYGLLPAALAVAAGGLSVPVVGARSRDAIEGGAADGSLFGAGTAVLLGIAGMMAWAAAT